MLGLQREIESVLCPLARKTALNQLLQVSGDLRKVSVLRALWGDHLSWFVPVLPLKVLSKLGPDYCRAQVGGIRSGSYGSVGKKRKKKETLTKEV